MTRFQLWKDWNKHCTNHLVYKILVLIGLVRSPSFEMHRDVNEKLSQFTTYTYSVHDDKPEKPNVDTGPKINWGWYIVYLLMIIINAIMCYVHDFNVFTWQYWVYAWMLILCFVSGTNYRKGD